MKFNIINKQTWDRIDYYNHFISDVPCTYSVTAEVNITDALKIIKENNLKLYPIMIYGISNIVNKYEEFRYSIDKSNNVGYYEYVNPSYTIFHKDTKTFSEVWTEYSNDFSTFYKRYIEDMDKYGDVEKIIAKPIEETNIINISCIPWVSFKGFNLNLHRGSDYLLPIFTIGKYHKQDGNILLPISIQVHHAVCDGFHVSRLINDLQDFIRDFKY